MHCNDTGTKNDKTVKEAFAIITERHYVEAVKEDATSIRMRLEEKNYKKIKKQMQIQHLNQVKRRRKAMMRKKWCMKNPKSEKETFLMMMMI